MTEWSKKNVYNSFNSMKGLCYTDSYKKIAKWFDRKGDLPPPIEVSIDPISSCNLDCYYCNSQRYIGGDEKVRKMTKQYLQDLIKKLDNWGVEGYCFGGGGESLTNMNVWTLPAYIAGLGRQSAVVTNGTIMNNTLSKELLYCRWVGFSVDASDAKTYESIHRVDKFDVVTQNILALVERRRSEGWSKCEIAFKFLVLPENYDKIHHACKFAKGLGVDDFHVRPVDLQRKDFRGTPVDFDMEVIENQFELCHAEETENFHVYTVKHKYDKEFHVKHDFDRCLASPLVVQCCTDGNVYVCVDHRMEEKYKLCSQNNIVQYWGSDKHRDLLNSIKPCEDCSRCTWSEYNKQVVEVAGKDRMCIAFP